MVRRFFFGLIHARLVHHDSRGKNAGENLIFVKLCQNDQKESWAQAWEFALRVCDNLGTAVKVELLPAPVQYATPK